VGATEIGDGSKVDNLVQVGHGSKVGENTLICAQTGLAGSSVIGNNVILAGQTGIAGHCTVGDGVVLTAQSAVSHDVPPGKVISGSPASTTASGCARSPSSSGFRSCSSGWTGLKRSWPPSLADSVPKTCIGPEWEPGMIERASKSRKASRRESAFAARRDPGRCRLPLLSRGRYGREPHRSSDSAA
jgi:hypothetical protein